MGENKINLTSSEIASLWTTYMNDSMSIQFLNYFLNTVEDSEVRSIIEMALNIPSGDFSYLTELFQQEDFPVPNGLSDSDVNLNAPRLYTDSFMLTYINHMSKAGMLGYSGFLSMSTRRDIRKFYKNGLNKTADLYDESSEVLLQKGLYVRSPYIDYPKQKDFVDSKSYLSGLNPFTNKRPLNAIEISHLNMNIQNNVIGVILAISFAQSSPRKEVQKLMLQGKDISEKHVKIFSSTLLDNNTQSPVSADVSITNSTAEVFSDKLIMFQMGLLTAMGTGNYATAAAASQRSDLVLNYERLSLEIAQYAKDIAYLMIQNEWLEQPPGTMDKVKLAQQKKQN
ncbi:DUF3231 family protein [Bacillus sp. ISL-40]|uniref:DUF3231 family protein n=1 Tax=unclassified Bacillus (in: firmicutes) TaxID=185979 RepID=UPI001BEC7962|nr:MULTISPECIES: DUF3231 family protein [unclassified Bacillus (in: firmicutes)]MBT2698841.1 DUF3231 family protein [Bacillus sp. ISL-40]MBT2720714.1 DUF3231 family protein [Bacillus sp. ISL-46]MBT2741011.1 DUF3231 family protein [Bacillus sp. ISL-77]